MTPDSGGSTDRPTGSVSIRPFAPGDQAATRALILAGLGDHFGFIDETMNPDLDDIAARYLARGDLFVVAEIDGELAGAGALIVDGPGVGRLVRMSVSKERRGRGIGRALVGHLAAVARARGDRRLVIETNDDWPDAIGLYRACGFVEFDRRDGEVQMALDVSIPSRFSRR